MKNGFLTRKWMNMNEWTEWLKGEWSKPYMKDIITKVQRGRTLTKIYPEHKDLLRAFKLTSYNETKVVIIGQDPYPLPNIADGLAFSTRQSKTPSSLEVIFNTLKNSKVGEEQKLEFNTNELTWWAKQGILLFNTALTVEVKQPLSHQEVWQPFTIEVLKKLDQHDKQLIFLFCGSRASAFAKLIKTREQGYKRHHIVFTVPHPAYEARGSGVFMEYDYFYIINELIKKQYRFGIDWSTYAEDQEPYPFKWNHLNID